MNVQEIVSAWGRILSGRRPSLSIEITRECPLRCPGCYAYELGHPGGGLSLRQLSDYKGDALVAKVLALVDEYRPLHLPSSVVIRWSAIANWMSFCLSFPSAAFTSRSLPVLSGRFLLPGRPSRVSIFSVSIDGLQPEHDLSPPSRHLRPYHQKYCRPSGGRALHYHGPDDATAPLPAGFPRFLDSSP